MGVAAGTEQRDEYRAELGDAADSVKKLGSAIGPQARLLGTSAQQRWILKGLPALPA